MLTAMYDPITLEIMWKRLISIADEAAVTLYRASFSTVVRESHDYSCMLLAPDCGAVVQSTRSIPSFIGTLPASLQHYVKHYPPDTLQPGDVIICNDPWICTGHLPDITMITPIFHHHRLVAYAGSIAHMTDIGGRVRAPDSLQLYEEGLQIPICKLYREGKLNEDVMAFIEHNVRVPDQVRGDLEAQVAANQIMARELEEFLEEYSIDDIVGLADQIQSVSESAMRRAIIEVPSGRYAYEATAESFDSSNPLYLKVLITVANDSMKIDFTGSAPQTASALNTVQNYTYAYTCYAVKAMLCPDVPNNEGSFRPIKVIAPEGSVLNARYPAAVAARATIGHYLPGMVFGALGSVLPEKVPAESGSPLFGIAIHGTDDYGVRFSGIFFFNGGQGASFRKDGLSCVSFPTNVSNTPLEILENTFPVEVERKQLVRDSGGAGRFRGGLGQLFTIRILAKNPCSVSLLSQRGRFPPMGVLGGKEGSVGKILLNGRPVGAGKPLLLRKGDKITIQTPGGGGFGEPRERSFSLLQRDIHNGLISKKCAHALYKIR
ncbi:MAG: hydantoinase B/oxoprolinase family protein [Deltaproteobacteria bacterium]|nr:hydantoinase B/oxoprolinase family protein [Deltaproteobacteria bacterium]